MLGCGAGKLEVQEVRGELRFIDAPHGHLSRTFGGRAVEWSDDNDWLGRRNFYGSIQLTPSVSGLRNVY